MRPLPGAGKGDVKGRGGGGEKRRNMRETVFLHNIVYLFIFLSSPLHVSATNYAVIKRAVSKLHKMCMNVTKNIKHLRSFNIFKFLVLGYFNLLKPSGNFTYHPV
jgi:hypothetical protein